MYVLVRPISMMRDPFGLIWVLLLVDCISQKIFLLNYKKLLFSSYSTQGHLRNPEVISQISQSNPLQ